MKQLRIALQERNEELLNALDESRISTGKVSDRQAEVVDLQKAFILGMVNSLDRISGYADLLNESPQTEHGEALLNDLLAAGEALAENLRALEGIQGSLEDLFYRDMEMFSLPVLLKAVTSPFLIPGSNSCFVIETAFDSSLTDFWYGPARGLNIVLTQVLRRCLAFPFLTGILVGVTGNICASGNTVPRFSITVSRRVPPFGAADSDSVERNPLENSDVFARCRCLLNIVGGELTSRHVSGGNLCMWLDIPLESVALPETGTVSPDAAFPELSALIVAGEAEQRKRYALLLQCLGWKASAVATCDEALKILRKKTEALQLVLVDTDSPDFNRTALNSICREADSAPEIVHTLIVSSRIMPGDVRQYSDAGCAALLEKPLRLGKLKNCLARTVYSPRSNPHIATDYSIPED
jgi:CheY-like chemotaxis protein